MEPTSERPTLIAIAVVEHDGCFLVGVRPEGKPLAGFAEFPGGKVDHGETLEQAAIRECREESGQRIEVVSEYLSTTYRYPHGLLEIHFFRCRLAKADAGDRDNEALQPRPPFRWVTLNELATLKFPNANRTLTEMLLRSPKGAILCDESRD